MPPYSLCMVGDDFLPGLTGVGVHVQTVSKALAQKGHRVAVITARHPGQPAFQEWQGVRVYGVPSLPLFGYRQAFGFSRFLRKVLMENEVEIVHYHYLGLLMFQTYHAAVSLGRKLKHVYTYHTPLELYSEPFLLSPFRGFFRWLHAHYANRLDLVVAPSRGLIEKLREYGVRTRVDVIFNPVETGDMGVLPESRFSLRRQSPDRFTVLYVGRLSPEKNVPLLLRGFALLLRHVPTAQLRLIGDGISRKALKKLAADLRLGDSVLFQGYLNRAELGRIYSAVDVLVLPSITEVQGLVAVEAMRFGLPIIVSDRITAATELVAHGINGSIVSSTDPANLARELESLAMDPARRQAMGAAGIERSKLYEVDRCVSALESAYRALTPGEP